MVKITIQNVIDFDGNGECRNIASNSFEDTSKSSGVKIKQSIKQSCNIEVDSITIKITRIMQDEPVNGLGDGDVSPDATGIGTDSSFFESRESR